MPEGQSEVKLVVKDLMDRGGVGFTYRVVVTPVETGFQLTLADEEVAIPRGGTALIPVTVTRTGYNGPIALDVLGVPAEGGVTVLPGTVPAGQTGGVVGLKAAAESTFEAREVQVVGKGKEGQTVAASRTIVFAQQTISTPGFGMAGTIPSYTRPLVSLTSAVIRPGPILLNPEVSKLVVPQGSMVEVPLQVVRTTGAEKKYKLAALSPPTGLSVAELEIGADQNERHGQGHGGGGRAARPAHGRPGRAGCDPGRRPGKSSGNRGRKRKELRTALAAPSCRRRGDGRGRGGPPREPGTRRQGNRPHAGKHRRAPWQDHPRRALCPGGRGQARRPAPRGQGRAPQGRGGCL